MELKQFWLIGRAFDVASYAHHILLAKWRGKFSHRGRVKTQTNRHWKSQIVQPFVPDDIIQLESHFTNRLQNAEGYAHRDLLLDLYNEARAAVARGENEAACAAVAFWKYHQFTVDNHYG